MFDYDSKWEKEDDNDPWFKVLVIVSHEFSGV